MTPDCRSTIALSSDEKSIYVASTTASHDGYVTDSLGYLDGWLIKMNLNGDTLWTDVVGGSYYDAITDVTATPDGGCVVCGYSNSSDGDFKNTKLHLNADMPAYVLFDGFIAKYSPDGVQEWIKLYGGQPLVEQTSVGSDELYKIICTKDGGYMAAGFTFSTSDDLPIDLERFRGGWLLKVDSKGKIQYTDKFTGINHNENNSNTLLDIIEVAENEYYAVGEQNYITIEGNIMSIENFLWVIKTDGKKKLAEIELGVKLNDTYGNSIVKGPDNTIFVSGVIQTTGGDIHNHYGMYDMWLVQLDNDLTLIDQRTFGGTGGEYPFQLVNDNLGHYLLTGYTNSHDNDAFGGYGGSDFWAVNFNENLDTLQTYRMGGAESDALTDAVFSKDGKSLYVTGRTKSSDTYIHSAFGNQDVWVAKINQDQTLSVNSPGVIHNEEKQISPNPSKGNFNIQGHKGEIINISDISGKVVYKTVLDSDNQSVNMKNFQKGIYFVKFPNNKVQKLILN